MLRYRKSVAAQILEEWDESEVEEAMSGSRWHGFKNRPTWALNAHLQGDRGLYEATLRELEGQRTDDVEHLTATLERFVHLLHTEHQRSPFRDVVARMLEDVGDIEAVDYKEVVESITDGLEWEWANEAE